MALHSCFQPASPQLTTPLPYKIWRLRAGLEVEESHTDQETVLRGCLEAPADSGEELLGGTGQCRGAVWHGGSSRGPDHRASPTLMADLQQLQQQDPVLRPVLAAWPARPPTSRNAPRGRWCSSTRDGSWRMGSSVVGRLTNIVVPVNSWFCPAQFGPMSKRGQELHQHLREVHCGAML